MKSKSCTVQLLSTLTNAQPIPGQCLASLCHLLQFMDMVSNIPLASPGQLSWPCSLLVPGAAPPCQSLGTQKSLIESKNCLAPTKRWCFISIILIKFNFIPIKSGQISRAGCSTPGGVSREWRRGAGSPPLTCWPCSL